MDLDVDEAFNVEDDFCSYFTVDKVHGEEPKETVMIIKRRYHQSTLPSPLVMVVDDDAPGGDEAESNSVPVGLLSVGSSLTLFLCVQSNLPETEPSPSGKLDIKE